MPMQQGWNSQTPAIRNLLSSAGRAVARGVKRRVKRSVTRALGGKKKRAARRASAKPARLVKGSAAAKRYMSKIRKMRKK